MNLTTITLAVVAALGSSLLAADAIPPTGHPDTKAAEWKPLFTADLSNAGAPEGVWSSKDRTWQCAAIFGRLPASKSIVQKPAELAPKGYIGLQGKHAGAPIFFRNIKIKSLD